MYMMEKISMKDLFEVIDRAILCIMERQTELLKDGMDKNLAMIRHLEEHIGDLFKIRDALEHVIREKES